MNRARRGARGFTLIELLVVCAIVVVITGVVLIDFNRFGGDVILENLAYDIALSVRETQVYGIAVERFGNSFTGYGMRFVTNSNTYVLFSDLEGTGVFDPQYPTSPAYPGGEVVRTETIQQGYVITGICTVPQVGGTACNAVSEVDILFKRPEPQAYISIGTNGNTPTSCAQNLATACQYEARITLTSPKGDTRDVVVDATGQISVQQ